MNSLVGSIKRTKQSSEMKKANQLSSKTPKNISGNKTRIFYPRINKIKKSNCETPKICKSEKEIQAGRAKSKLGQTESK